MESSWTCALNDFLSGLVGHKEAKTVRFYKVQLTQLAAWASEADIALPDFRAKHMRTYMTYRKEDAGVGDTTRVHDARCAKVFMRFVKAEGYSDVDALKEYAVPHAPVASVAFPTTDELALLLSAMRSRWDSKHNPLSRYVDKNLRLFLRRRDYAIVCLLVDSAARIGEILALTMKDLNLSDPKCPQITFRKTKGKEPRTVPLKSSVAPLTEWLAHRAKAQHNRDGDWVFYSTEAQPLNPLAFSKSFGGYRDYAGLRNFTLHSLRHYALTILSNRDLKAAVAIAGHKDPKTTMRYARQDAAAVRVAHAEADPLGKALLHKRAETTTRRRVV